MPRGSRGASVPLAVRPPLLRQALFPLASSVAGKPDDPGHDCPSALLSEKGMPSLPFTTHDPKYWTPTVEPIRAGDGLAVNPYLLLPPGSVVNPTGVGGPPRPGDNPA